MTLENTGTSVCSCVRNFVVYPKSQLEFRQSLPRLRFSFLDQNSRPSLSSPFEVPVCNCSLLNCMDIELFDIIFANFNLMRKEVPCQDGWRKEKSNGSWVRAQSVIRVYICYRFLLLWADGAHIFILSRSPSLHRTIVLTFGWMFAPLGTTKI